MLELVTMAAVSFAGGYIIDDYLSRRNWMAIFKSTGLYIENKYPEVKRTENNKIGKRYIFKVPYGLCLSDFEKRIEELEMALHEPIKCDLTNDYNIAIQIYHLAYKKIYKLVSNLLKTNDLVFPIGMTLTTEGEENVSLEFNRSNSHMLVCGGTGKGKTAFMQNLIAQAMLKRNLEVYICDLKATGSYNVFKNCFNLKELVKSDTETVRILKKILNIMQQRYKKLDEHNLNDAGEYNEKFKNEKMNRIILVIEEFVILSKNKKVIDLLNILLAQASGAGIHIFLTVQRPDAKTLDTRLKNNLSYTVAFKAKNSSSSETYLDKGDYRAATDLRKPGEAILVKDDEDIYFKSYFSTNEEIENLVKKTYVKKKTESNVIELPKAEPQKEEPDEAPGDPEPEDDVL
jgi:S-DNA-T family DNA segregation ATPase FtsK/SpoIIIE